MNELALFAGAGGGILGGYLLGWRTICAVERDAYAAQVLAQRQNDGALPPFPIWSDVRAFDGTPWRGLVDVVSGGFPCQDISAAGSGQGIEGSRSGLWKEMARIISEVRCRYVLLENSPLLVGRGLALVLGDLAAMGYDAHWCRLSAADCRAPHQRDRIWLVAYPDSERQPQPARQQQNSRMGPEQRREAMEPTISPEPTQRLGDLADAGRTDCKRVLPERLDAPQREKPRKGSPGSCGHGLRPWPPEPGMGRVADGMAYRMDRLKALGNGQVPRVAAAAFDFLRHEV
ncbi:DNA cytosine methyltransferase [Pseudomonas viridiflava]|uniref:DNA cytosine methyltransferase n=1 Tax=Pseudomonas viridiflava TaxID=33069 RepID=UPI000F03296C|nr:DNA cytosine methyltransferase [Pseudomonas viridiflava]